MGASSVPKAGRGEQVRIGSQTTRGPMMRRMVDTRASLEDAVRTLLSEIGEDAGREGLLRTPERVRRMYDELTAERQEQDALLETYLAALGMLESADDPDPPG